jgi:hypothetical protein
MEERVAYESGKRGVGKRIRVKNRKVQKIGIERR